MELKLSARKRDLGEYLVTRSMTKPFAHLEKMSRTTIACLLPFIQPLLFAQDLPDPPQSRQQDQPNPPEVAKSEEPVSSRFGKPAPPPPAKAAVAGIAESSSAQKPPAATAPQGITAMEALRRTSERFGSDVTSLLIEMTGPDGQTQPNSWEIIAVDLSTPHLARTYAVYPRAVVDKGINREFYPDRIPTGFIATGKLAVGSYDAFVALDKAAGDAKIGFDSIQYRLRAREGTNEPVWTMTALDIDGFAVGIVDVSGTTGKSLAHGMVTPGGDSDAPDRGRLRIEEGVAELAASACRYQGVLPPFTHSVWPVTNDASSLAK